MKQFILYDQLNPTGQPWQLKIIGDEGDAWYLTLSHEELEKLKEALAVSLRAVHLD